MYYVQIQSLGPLRAASLFALATRTLFRLNLQEEGSGVKETGAVTMETDIEIKQEPIEPRPQNEVITIDIDDDIILIDTDTTMKYLSGEYNGLFTRNEICPVTEIRSRY